MSYTAPAGELARNADAELARALASTEQSFGKSSVVQRVRLESGQGELWALVASPCGTASEGADDAGSTALVLRSIAARRSGLLGVALEAWATPDGAGLLAHAPRLGPNESPEAHARRVGEALGRALAAPRLSGSEVADQRAALLREIGPAERRGLWLALDAASAGHPSWLDPRGTWSSVSAASAHELTAHRRELLLGPLRLAVLANSGRNQAPALASALELWLKPMRRDARACAAPPRGEPKPGEISFEVEDESLEAAYVVVPLPPTAGGPSRAAEWSVHLLDRPGGLLHSALAALDGGAKARATVLGGERASALLIEVRVAEGSTAAAVAQVRGLLERMSKGVASNNDVQLARAHFAQLDAEALLDPRRRLLELWRGSPPKSADLAQLQRLHAALAPASHIVVSGAVGK